MTDNLFPHGAIPKINARNPRHRQLVSGHEAVTYMFVRFTNAGHFERNPDDYASLLAPDQELILANVDPDEDLVGRTPDDEMGLVETLEPAFYIPTDRWVYEDTMTPAAQLEEIDRCMNGTREVFHRLAERDDLSTTVIPIAKGWKAWHFERCLRTFEELGVSYCAYDVTQYNSIKMIIADVRRLVNVIAPDGILLIGKLSPSHLRRCPPEVVAATGVDHWRKNCQLRDGNFSREKYRIWTEEANAAIRIAQSRLDQFKELSDVRIHG